MPNNTRNIIKFVYHEDKGEKINEIYEFLRTDKHYIDFNKIIPPPENLFKEPLGNKERERCEKEGVPNWYDWNSENWGTKWNSYETELRKKGSWQLVITFETAWDMPRPIIEHLLKKYPEVDIQVVSACEGGWFACHIIKNENEEPITREWTKENDPEGTIRGALFSALNHSY
jgi:hypothetical protein